MDPRIAGAPPPARRFTGRMHFASPPPKGYLDVTIGTQQIVAVYRHWHYPPGSRKGRSAICPGPDYCDFHANGQEAEWQGWIACLCPDRKGWQAVSFSYPAAVALLNLFREGEPLRGRRVRMVRLGDERRSPVSWEPTECRPLPLGDAEPDIWPTLASVYGSKVYLYHPTRSQEGR